MNEGPAENATEPSSRPQSSGNLIGQSPPSPAALADRKSGRPNPPVAGIGASAGGLDAFKRLFSAMPVDSGVAFVIIPHLDPKHESLMVELLARCTQMPVVEATDGTAVEANRVYVIPPNKYMTISDGILRLTGPVERGGLQTSIDLFLRSLAGDKQEKAIGIILSGTGSHGSLGLKAIKASHGMTMVQDPSTAEHPQMPQCAINTGLADYVLPVEKMPESLTTYVRQYINGAETGAESTEATNQLDEVLALLRGHTDFDFGCYRKKMLLRRIERRMSLSHFNQIADYLGFLREHPDEIKQLFRDLLISVTNFFRDPEAFQTLEARVIASLIRGKEPNAPLRLWCAGCATGEEPYSLVMLLLEQLAAAQKSCQLQVFATDVDEDALEAVRGGTYPESIATDVSPERLRRFFVRMDDLSYQVNKQLREVVTIGRQNLINDAPFPKLDLIVCRNTLIYLEPEIQVQIITSLHSSLNEGGFLFLGSSETIGQQIELFEPVSKKWRIFRRLGPARPEHVEIPVAATDPLASARQVAPPSKNGDEGALLVTFQDADEGSASRGHSEPAAARSAIGRMEDELKATKENLQNTIEELESSNEELRVANEEAMSSNEELQSANEELESSKEELQSLNEELGSVNNQLHDKIEELESANNDVANLLKCTDVAILLLDKHFKIKRYTDAVARLFSLKATDIDRSIKEIAPKFADSTLTQEIDHVLETMSPQERQVQTLDGSWWSQRITLYLTQENRVEGVVLTFTDVTHVRRADEEARRLATVLRDSNDAVSVQEFDGRITAWNRGAAQMLGYSEAEALQMNMKQMIPEGSNAEASDHWERLRQGQPINSWESQRRTKDGRILDVWVTATALKDSLGQPTAMAKTERDITARKVLEREVVEIASMEQRRIGQDLHDSVGQELTALNMLADDLVETLRTDPANGSKLVEMILQGLGRSQRELRTVLRGLLPVAVDAEGLMAALSDLAGRIQSEGRAICKFDCARPVSVADNLTATHLYLIAREAVHNAVKHAKPMNIRIILISNGFLVLRVRDDGIGMPALAVDQQGGLRIMRNRAAIIGATLTIQPDEPIGTLVTCTLGRKNP
jgi:PAS domain S-box-containing protein